MPWWLILIIAISVVLAYAAWDHRKESRHLAEIFAPLAEKHRGVVTAGRLLALPQLRFTLDQRPFLATAMANSGAIGDPRTARRIAGGGTGAPENALSDAQNGLASSLGCSTRPARCIPRGPVSEIAWNAAFRGRILMEGKPNGECRIIIPTFS